MLVIAAEHDAIVPQKTCRLHLFGFSPSGGPIGFDLFGLARSPNRHADRDGSRDQTARRGDVGTFHKDRRCVGVIGIPPPEEGGRQVKWKTEQAEPGLAQFRLEGQPPGHPFGRAPNAEEDNRKNGEDLAPENFGRGHRFRLSSEGQRPIPRLRAKLQSMPPSERAMPETWRSSCFSSEGVQGTSWKPRPSSIMAKRPEASV